MSKGTATADSKLKIQNSKLPFARFQCQPGCTRCCDGEGSVYLSEEDIVRLASFLDLTPAECERRYIYRTRNLRRLRTPRNGPCRFLGPSGCAVYAARPTQCRTFPFWPEILGDRKEARATAKYCPGIGKGELIQIEDAYRQADDMCAAHPQLYRRVASS